MQGQGSQQMGALLGAQKCCQPQLPAPSPAASQGVCTQGAEPGLHQLAALGLAGICVCFYSRWVTGGLTDGQSHQAGLSRSPLPQQRLRGRRPSRLQITSCRKKQEKTGREWKRVASRLETQLLFIDQQLRNCPCDRATRLTLSALNANPKVLSQPRLLPEA